MNSREARKMRMTIRDLADFFNTTPDAIRRLADDSLPYPAEPLWLDANGTITVTEFGVWLDVCGIRPGEPMRVTHEKMLTANGRPGNDPDVALRAWTDSRPMIYAVR